MLSAAIVSTDEYQQEPDEFEDTGNLIHSQGLNKLVHLNKYGMEYLSNGNFKESHLKLKLAEKIVTAMQDNYSDDYYKLYSLTMNNLGCYYKKIFKPNVALKYLKLAL